MYLAVLRAKRDSILESRQALFFLAYIQISNSQIVLSKWVLWIQFNSQLVVVNRLLEVPSGVQYIAERDVALPQLWFQLNRLPK